MDTDIGHGSGACSFCVYICTTVDTTVIYFGIVFRTKTPSINIIIGHYYRVLIYMNSRMLSKHVKITFLAISIRVRARANVANFCFKPSWMGSQDSITENRYCTAVKMNRILPTSSARNEEFFQICVLSGAWHTDSRPESPIHSNLL